MNKDKNRLIAIVAVLGFGLLVMLSFAIMVVQSDGYSIGNIMAVIAPFLIMIFISFFVLRRYKDVKKGLPLDDERSKKVMTMASSRAFYVSLYWLLAISMLEEFFANIVGLEHLSASQTVGGGILGMAMAFIIFWIYYDRKGNLM